MTDGQTDGRTDADGQTDRQTLHDSKDRAYASHRAVKIRRAAGTCHSVLTKRCAFRRRAKVAVDSVDKRSSDGKLFQVSGPDVTWSNILSCASKRTPRFDTTDENRSYPVESATSLTVTLDSCGRVPIDSS